MIGSACQVSAKLLQTAEAGCGKWIDRSVLALCIIMLYGPYIACLLAVTGHACGPVVVVVVSVCVCVCVCVCVLHSASVYMLYGS